MSLFTAYKEGFKTSALLVAIVVLYGVAGALDDDNQDSTINTWLRNLTASNEN